MNNLEKKIYTILREFDYIPLWELVWEDGIRDSKETYVNIIQTILKNWYENKYIQIYQSEWSKDNYSVANLESIFKLNNWNPDTADQFYTSISLTKHGYDKLSK